jgi:hypothetical protein
MLKLFQRQFPDQLPRAAVMGNFICPEIGGEALLLNLNGFG